MKKDNPAKAAQIVQPGAPEAPATEHPSARSQVPPKGGARLGDRLDPTETAILAELESARAERRWVDAKAAAEDLKAYRIEMAARGAVVDLSAVRKARGAS